MIKPDNPNSEFTLGGINHVALVCSDMQRTVDFYSGVLGMPLIKSLDLPGGMGQHFFFDAGNTFSNDQTTFTGTDGITPVDYEFSFDKIKYSTGVAVQWLAPLGVFRFSYAVPLNSEKAKGVEYGDRTEEFQFSIGQAF